MFGELLATPAERIDTSGGTGTVELGDRRALRSTYSPGHASPHVGLMDSQTVYVGDQGSDRGGLSRNTGAPGVDLGDLARRAAASPSGPGGPAASP